MKKIEKQTIFEAMARFQAECPVVQKNKKGAWGQYADLAGIWQTIRKPLTDNGLSLIQVIVSKEDGQYLVTKLCHSSGDCIDSECRIDFPGKNIQHLGSAITYYRRYALSAMLGISADVDVDDISTINSSTFEVNDRITASQASSIDGMINGDSELRKRMLDWAQVSKVEDIKKSQYASVIKALKRRSEDETGN